MIFLLLLQIVQGLILSYLQHWIFHNLYIYIYNCIIFYIWIFCEVFLIKILCISFNNMNMFSRTPGSVTKINISVADCTVSHTYLEHDGSLNIFIEPKLEPSISWS